MGEDPNANKEEDDYETLVSDGLPLRAADHGGSSGAATRDVGVTLERTTNKGGQTQATAQVAVKDARGNNVAGAAVAGNWSGAVSGSGRGTTNASGVASIGSSRTQSSGTFVFTVTGVSLSGYTYVPTNNTTGSVTR